MKSFAFAAALVGAVSAAASDHWAVLVAGSSGYSNYRHQADTMHAYQIMKANGIPESNIIHMAYDDIANNYRNPFPGKLYNHPDGENVYDASSLNYTGKQVTPQNFLAVLKGDAKTAGGRVLESTSASKVFVYFADHGAPGLIAFPSSYLYADDLQAAIDYMETNNMYDQMTFYVEACESGSMFPDLKASQNVYAVTASNATESSWAAYCSPNDKVNGTHVGSCLGDLFSVNWMEDSDANNADTETLTTQFNTVKKLTTASPVMKFGDFEFMGEPIGDFQGIDDAAAVSTIDSIFKNNIMAKESKANESALVDSRDAELHHLTQQVLLGNEGAHEDLKAEVESRMEADYRFSSFFDHADVALVSQPEDFDCLRFMMNTYEENCGRFTDYSLKYVKHLVHVCETESSFNISKTASKIADICNDRM